MANVIKILKHATPRSLVLLDELGSSTDPEEGSALAKAIVGHLAERGVPTVVTTHHRTVAAFAEAVPNVTNASFQLDPETLKPTYELVMGVPGRSYAMAVAERLGLPAEIMAESRALLEPQHLRFEDWLNELQRDRQQLQSSLEEAEGFRAEAESLRSRLDEQVDYLIAHRDDMLDSARRDVASRFDEVKRKLQGAEASLAWESPTGATPSGNPPERLERIERIRRDLGAQQLPAPVRQRPIEQRPIGIGDTVFVRGLNLRGSVTALPSQSSDAEVAIGNVRINVDVHRLSHVEADAQEDIRQQQRDERVHYDLGPAIEKVELDLHGFRVDEALMRLEEYLDSAVRDGVEKVRIIHGRGTGALRDAIREHLQRHPLVNSYGPESRERGGNGATYVELA
jgi:DNA mismatch repair protein MutS2